MGHNPKAAPGGVPAPRTAGVYDHFGVWATGPASVQDEQHNTFLNDTVSVAQG